MTLADLESMPVEELESWREYMAAEPFGEHIADLRAGMVAATIANCHRDPKVRREPFQALEFAPWNPVARKTNNNEPVLLADPKAQQRLIEQTLFGSLLKKDHES